MFNKIVFQIGLFRALRLETGVPPLGGVAISDNPSNGQASGDFLRSFSAPPRPQFNEGVFRFGRRSNGAQISALVERPIKPPNRPQ